MDHFPLAFSPRSASRRTARGEQKSNLKSSPPNALSAAACPLCAECTQAGFRHELFIALIRGQTRALARPVWLGPARVVRDRRASDRFLGYPFATRRTKSHQRPVNRLNRQVVHSESLGGQTKLYFETSVCRLFSGRAGALPWTNQ
jgi:hypothetical protein